MDAALGSRGERRVLQRFPWSFGFSVEMDRSYNIFFQSYWVPLEDMTHWGCFCGRLWKPFTCLDTRHAGGNLDLQTHSLLAMQLGTRKSSEHRLFACHEPFLERSCVHFLFHQISGDIPNSTTPSHRRFC